MVVVVGRRYAHTSVAAQVLMNILLNEMVVVGCGFLPLLHSYGAFPGDVTLDYEGIDSLQKSISRIVEWHHLVRGEKQYENIINR
jgi:hypothetical protein